MVIMIFKLMVTKIKRVDFSFLQRMDGEKIRRMGYYLQRMDGVFIFDNGSLYWTG
jgi:hypothetical protein